MEWYNPVSASPEITLKMHKAEIERRMIQAALLSEIKGERAESRTIAEVRAAALRLLQIVRLFHQVSAPIRLPAEPKFATSTGEIRAVK